MHLQYSQLKFTRIRNSHRAKRWVMSVFTKKLLFTGPRELEKSTLSAPRTIDNNEY